jgi:hypothetical protein
MLCHSIGSSPFKNQVLVRFNHIIYIRQGINITTPVVPFLYAIFELLARFTSFHCHTPLVVLRRYTRSWQNEPVLRSVNFIRIFSNYYANAETYDKIDSSI